MCLEVIVYGSILRYIVPVQVVHLYFIQSINQGCVSYFTVMSVHIVILFTLLSVLHRYLNLNSSHTR